MLSQEEPRDAAVNFGRTTSCGITALCVASRGKNEDEETKLNFNLFCAILSYDEEAGDFTKLF